MGLKIAIPLGLLIGFLFILYIEYTIDVPKPLFYDKPSQQNWEVIEHRNETKLFVSENNFTGEFITCDVVFLNSSYVYLKCPKDFLYVWYELNGTIPANWLKIEQIPAIEGLDCKERSNLNLNHTGNYMCLKGELLFECPPIGKKKDCWAYCEPNKITICSQCRDYETKEEVDCK